MWLHKNKENFTEAVQAVSRGLNISPALVEKDYYVTLVLKRINEEVSGLIFKGGTSLSKCHKAINRFSEDIDLTLDSEHLTEGQRKIVKPTIVKRNIERFPEKFCFQSAENELEMMWSQFVTASTSTLDYNKYRSKKYLPYVFTEQGTAL